MKNEKGSMKEKYDSDDENEYDKEGNMMKGGGYYKKAGKMCEMSKSDDLDEDDLQKSLDKLDEFSKSEDEVTRKEFLLQKASEESLSKSENDELFQLLGGSDAHSDEDAIDPITKSMTDNEPLQKAVDVSGYLQENHDALVKSLGAVGEAIDASDNRRHEFAILQAKTLVDIGNMVKSLADTVNELAGQPVGGPRSRGVNQNTPVLQKSFSNQQPVEDRMSQSDVMDGLDVLMKKSMADGNDGRLASTNERIDLAVSKFETSGQISPTMLEAVKQEMGASH